LLKGKITLPLIEAWENDAFVLVTSEELIEELAEVVARPRLRAYIPKRDADKFIELIYRKAIVVKPSEKPPLCRDPDDYPVLGSAIAGQADFIVTGDDDFRECSEAISTPNKSIPLMTTSRWPLTAESRGYDSESGGLTESDSMNPRIRCHMRGTIRN